MEACFIRNRPATSTQTIVVTPIRGKLPIANPSAMVQAVFDTVFPSLNNAPTGGASLGLIISRWLKTCAQNITDQFAHLLGSWCGSRQPASQLCRRDRQGPDPLF